MSVCFTVVAWVYLKQILEDEKHYVGASTDNDSAIFSYLRYYTAVLDLQYTSCHNISLLSTYSLSFPCKSKSNPNSSGHHFRMHFPDVIVTWSWFLWSAVADKGEICPVLKVSAHLEKDIKVWSTGIVPACSREPLNADENSLEGNQDVSPSGIGFVRGVLGCLAEGEARSWLLCTLLRCSESGSDYLNIFFHGIMFYCLIYFIVLRTLFFVLFLVQMGPSAGRASYKEG